MYKVLFTLNILISLFIICSLAFGYTKVDKSVKPYVDEYNAIVETFCPDKSVRKHYNIKLSKELPDPDWIGYCARTMISYNIDLLESYWIEANFNVRRQLVYHEMAHCVIDKEHETNGFHYMNPKFEEFPEEFYMPQVIADIKTWCKE